MFKENPLLFWGSALSASVSGQISDPNLLFGSMTSRDSDLFFKLSLYSSFLLLSSLRILSSDFFSSVFS